jgi:decaprenylphospho-beta-D-ribofuranose 2-oxidase
MHNHSDSLPDVPSTVEKLGCYSGLYETEARVFRPTTDDQVRKVFAFARENDCRVTIRGGAHSFDRQSLGDDLVISMAGFDDIEVDLPNKQVRVGPGATWGHILEALETHRLMPAVTVTTSHATAGGTLAGDCLSRFSPAYGKEGTCIKSFELLTVDGKVLVCTPPGRNVPPINWTPEQHAFSGVIGGLGYLGVVTSITYKVLAVKGPGPIRMTTTMKKLRSFDGLADELMRETARTEAESSDPNDDTMLDAIYSALHASRRGRKTALLFTSKVVTGRKRRRLLIHWPKFVLRIPAEWLLRTRIGVGVLWRFFFGTVSEKKDHYVDDLDGYTFFMDGNVRAKHAGKSLGRKMQTIQQTFVIPSDLETDEGRSKTKKDLTKWLDDTSRHLAEKKLTPAMFDVMWLPADRLFPLSATADLAGFAVSYAFETSSKRKQKRIEESFREMSDHLWSTFQGRVYLVKNVQANPQTLRAMYHPQAEEFFKLKQQLDPHCILRNRFLDEYFEPLLECTPLPTPPARAPREAVAQPEHT